MSYNIEDFEKEINKRIEVFLLNIESVCREGFVTDRERTSSDTSGFPIFEIADSLYYKSKFQEGYLEWRVRDGLVNVLLNYLFTQNGIDIRWMFSSGLTTGGVRNEENEKRFPVEFFVVKNGMTIAYRYTLWEADYSIEYNLPRTMYLDYFGTGVKKIDKWVSIDWSGDSREEVIKKHRLDKILEKYEPFQTVITIKDLFFEYFTEKEYELFIQKIKDAVKKANQMLGFQTVPRLVSNKLTIFKDEVVSNLLNVNFESLRYYAVDHNGIHDSSGGNGELRKIDYKCINENFIGKSRYLALVGTSDFAQSFITSEYLYKIFKDNVAFDYTSVVLGYIKSVEQLCRTIIYDIIIPCNDERLWIKVKKLPREDYIYLHDNDIIKQIGDKEKYNYIPMKRDYRDYYDMKMTMGHMFYFFHVNREKLYNVGFDESETTIFECMQNFVSFDRNGYLHKDNIRLPDVAERIRNNTFLILYWLLGLTVLTGKEEEDNGKLGIYDDFFDRMYRKIAFRRRYKYVICFKGEQPKKVIRVLIKPEYEVDEKGNIDKAELVFYEVDEYPENYPEYYRFIDTISKCKCQDKIIIVDRNHIPERMILIEKDGSEVRIV